MSQREQFERIKIIFFRIYYAIGFVEILFSCVIIFFMVSKFPETITVDRDKDGLPVFAETYLVIINVFAKSLILGLLPYFSAFCEKKYPKGLYKSVGLPYRPPIYGSIKTFILRYCISTSFAINVYVWICFWFSYPAWEILQISLGNIYKRADVFFSVSSWICMVYVFHFLLDIYAVQKKHG
jgi:hypothetical protein